MALVAYSDDSDLGSDAEDIEENVDGGQHEVKIKTTTEMVKSGTNVLASSSSLSIVKQKALISSSDIDNIVDEDNDESHLTNRPSRPSILASIPAATPVNRSQNVGLELSELEDEVTDVPTVDTWKVTAELKKSGSDENQRLSESKSSFVPSKREKIKPKVKFFVPSLSEFDNDDDDEEEPKEEPERKKLKPSVKGTGLFSMLPEPKHISVKETKRALIPYILTKGPPVKKPSKPIPAAVKKPEVVIDSDEEDAAPCDFFSLSESSTPVDLGAVNPMPEPDFAVEKTTLVSEVGSSYLPKIQKDTIGDARHRYGEQIPAEFAKNCQQQEELPYPFQPQMESSEDPSVIDQDAIIRLMGKRRGKNEAINFIDVNADDALLTRDEWMTKSLSEEKPTHSFSKKRDGLPSQKQKQKHQITYLAHQAKERELELKNNWAQNRMTKMQTQAKYGF